MSTRATIERFLRDEDGPTAAEYAVMLALILLVVIAAITALGNTSSSIWKNDADKIAGALGS